MFYGLLRGLEKADKVLHGIYRDEPLNWVLHQESRRIETNWTGLGVQRGRSTSSQGMARQGHKQQGAGTGHTLASFLSLEFQNEESVQQQHH